MKWVVKFVQKWLTKIFDPPAFMHRRVHIVTIECSNGEYLGTDFAFYLLSFMLLDVFAVE